MNGYKNLYFILLLLSFLNPVKANKDVSDVLIEGDSTLMGMRVESFYFCNDAFLIETTGARFEYAKGKLKVYQGLDCKTRRLVLTISFSHAPTFTLVNSNDDHVVFWSKDLNLGIYGDSTCIISPKTNQPMNCRGNFKPDYEGRYKGELLLIDDLGGIEIYPQRYEAGYKIKHIELGRLDWRTDYELNAGERVMVAAFPGREFDWEESFNTRIVITHGAMGLGAGNYYGQMPPNKVIEKWSKDYDVLVLFYKGLYKRPEGNHDALRSYGPYVIENEKEFRRMLRDAHAKGMKVITYSSLFSHYRKFKNEGSFYKQIESLKEKFGINGVYIDGLRFDHRGSKDDDKIANLEMIRRLRELFGRDGVIMLHGTHDAQYGNPVATAPNIDSYCTVTLNGEGVAFDSVDTPYIKYQVKKYGISNTIGMWRSDGRHPQYITDKEIVDALIEMNCRDSAYAYVPLYEMPGPQGYRWGDGMNTRYKYYLKKLANFKNVRNLKNEK